MNGLQSDAQKELRGFIESIERLEEQKKGITDDIKDIFEVAKGKGYDTKIMKKVISARKKSRDELKEEMSILDVYLHAMGMLEDEVAA